MLAELLSSLRGPDGDRPAVGRLTRSALADLADRYAIGLRAQGLAAGDTLGVAVRPGGSALALMLAAWRLGVRVAVLDPSAGPDVLAARLALAAPALVVADAAGRSVAGWARPLARRAGLALPPLASLGPVVSLGRLARARGAVPKEFSGDGDAVIVFTSGTTASPRAVVHTRASLSAGMRAVASLVSPVAGVPVVGGTFFVLVPSLASGAPVALPARSPARLARQIARLRPQATYLTPPAVRSLLAERPRLHGRFYSGSAPVSASLLGRLRAAGASEAFGVYALTELFPAAVVSAAEKQAYEGPGDLVGPPLPGVRCTVDASGQLLLDGPGRFSRYLGSPPPAWVATGDLGRLTPSGAVVLGGRLKDMVLRRAENIYPGLYEPALHVAGVDLAVLVGVPVGDGDEALVALVQPAPGASRPAVTAALAPVLERMGSARPDRVLFGAVPTAGRSRKPDRAAAAAAAAARWGE